MIADIIVNQNYSIISKESAGGLSKGICNYPTVSNPVILWYHYKSAETKT